MIAAVIFDFDGLLVDSEPVWDEACDRFLDHHAISRVRGNQVMERGMGMYESIAALQERAGLVGEPTQLVAQWRSFFYELVHNGGGLVLMPGARILVEHAARAGKVALATCGHPREVADEVLVKLGIRDRFDLLICCDDVGRGKPEPDVYLETARQLGVPPADCLVLEDSANGVLAAKRAGMWCCGVNPDVDWQAQLKGAGADKVFASLTEIDLAALAIA